MQTLEWQVPVGHQATRALFEPTDAAGAPAFVCAHGAGGHMSDPGMQALAEVFRGCGMHVVRFDFLYRYRQVRVPDAMPLLKETIAAVAARARSEIDASALIIGGRSMGGRAASHLAAQGFRADGLLLLAYPLHPAGKPDKLRDRHLEGIAMPVLCLNGTRDALCRRDLMEGVLERSRENWTMHWLEGADHSFHVLRSSGRSDADVLDEIGAAARAWWSRVTADATAG